MDKKLKNLFDYQKFKKNPQLARMIAESESRYSRELDDEEIALVSAAGEPSPNPIEEDEDGNPS